MIQGTSYSTIVIGAGSGGLTVALGLANLGKRVALVEERYVGGDCTNVGCIPSKTLIYLAEHGDQSAAAVLATVQAKRNHLRDEETHDVQRADNLDYFQGRARFTAPKHLDVALADGAHQQLSADNIVIATGSRPRDLQLPGLPQERMLTNESVFEQQDAPQHLAIIGSGVIAMELAFAFRKLGSRVTIITKSQRVLANGVEAASQVLHDSLNEQGIRVYYGATATNYDAATSTLRLDAGGQPQALEAVDRVLIAVGRMRNLEQLGLEQTGVDWNQKGVTVDQYGATNVSGIYAIGDVTPDSHWTHSANAQGRRVVQRIAFPLLPAWSGAPLYPNATFSDPEVANVGLMPEQIAKRYHPGLIKTIRVDLPKTDRGYTEGLTRGFIQVYAVRLTGRILGATIVGPRAAEMISFFTLAISERISLYRLYRLVYPYPTHSSGIQKVADTFVRETLPQLPSELRDVTRYALATVWRRLGLGQHSSSVTESQPSVSRPA